MRKILFFLLILVFFLRGNSQENRVDSLVAVAQKAKNDIDKINLYNLISDEYKATNPVLMLVYATKALQLADTIKFNRGKANAFLNVGNANIIKGDYSAALLSFLTSKSIFEQELAATSPEHDLQLKSGLARTYGSIGIVFSEQSNYSKALLYDLKALKIYEELGENSRLARVYNNVGIIYKAQDDSFKALQYFLKALKIQQNYDDRTIAITLTNIGNCYMDQKSPERAADYYNKALEALNKNPDQRALGELYNNFGLYYQSKNLPDRALLSYNQALKAFASIEDKFGASDSYALIGEVHFINNRFKEALENTNKSLQLAKEIGVLERIQDSEKMLVAIYEKIGQPEEALRHYRLYSAAKDSVSSVQNIRNSVRAEMNFEFDKKETLQKKELEKREILYEEQGKRHVQQIIFAVLIVVLLFGVIFLIYSRRQLKTTLTLQKELAEYEQKALHLQMNPHFVFNCLGSISSFIVQNGTDQAIKYLSKFSKLMRLTLEYSKESLIPVDKEIESLQNYLELEQLRFNQKFNFCITKSVDIEDDMALPPLLIQPFVENAIIHGLVPSEKGGQIDISFSVDSETLICTIADTGIGFHKSQELKEKLVSVHKSMALDITRKRLKMMEAITLKTSKVEITEINDTDGCICGTKVTLTLPAQYIK